MSYERPQRSNPHGLTTRQHTFPVASIKRFASADGTVAVQDIKRDSVLHLTPNNAMFYTKRAWDQRAEAGFMKHTEEDFQCLASAILSGSVKTLSVKQNRRITKFWVLWRLRTDSRFHSIPDLSLKEHITGVTYEATKDNQECLEKKGVSTIRPNLTVPGRSVAAGRLQLEFNRRCLQLGETAWGLIHCDHYEFLVPDVPDILSAMVVPLAPNSCLVSGVESRAFERAGVATINRQALQAAREYWFAQDMAMCPR